MLLVLFSFSDLFYVETTTEASKVNGVPIAVARVPKLRFDVLYQHLHRALHLDQLHRFRYHHKHRTI